MRPVWQEQEEEGPRQEQEDEEEEEGPLSVVQPQWACCGTTAEPPHGQETATLLGYRAHIGTLGVGFSGSLCQSVAHSLGGSSLSGIHVLIETDFHLDPSRAKRDPSLPRALGALWATGTHNGQIEMSCDGDGDVM